MSISENIKDYKFTVNTEHLKPLLAEPIVQAAVQVIGYIGAALITLREFLELCKMLRLGEVILAILSAYATSQATYSRP